MQNFGILEQLLKLPPLSVQKVSKWGGRGAHVDGGRAEGIACTDLGLRTSEQKIVGVNHWFFCEYELPVKFQSSN